MVLGIRKAAFFAASISIVDVVPSCPQAVTESETASVAMA